MPATRDSAPRSSTSTARTPAPAAATTSCSAARRRPTARSCAGPICSAAWSRYWHNHPSLSYLFSGTFIGPTSQAPRVDEGRRDARYELEIAFEQVDAPVKRRRHGWSIASSATCWSTAPATRIAPSSASTSCSRPIQSTGRLGLVEFRAFEMPPHARMSLAQQLLLRALRRAVLENAVHRNARRLGHVAARPLHAAALRATRISTT